MNRSEAFERNQRVCRYKFAESPHPDANQHRSGTVGAKQGAAGTNRNMLRAHVFRAKQERI